MEFQGPCPPSVGTAGKRAHSSPYQPVEKEWVSATQISSGVHLNIAFISTPHDLHSRKTGRTCDREARPSTSNPSDSTHS